MYGLLTSIKNLLYGFRGNFSCETRRVIPGGTDSSILPARVANHSTGFDSSCPLTEFEPYNNYYCYIAEFFPATARPFIG